LFEQLAVWTKRGAKVRFDQQSGIHNTVIIQVEQLIAQPARGAERRKGRVDASFFAFSRRPTPSDRLSSGSARLARSRVPSPESRSGHKHFAMCKSPLDKG